MLNNKYFLLLLQVVLFPGLVYNISQFSGIVFQVVAEHKRKKIGLEVLAAGGRFDDMIANYRRPNSPAIAQYGVGVSVAFDKVRILKLIAHSSLLFFWSINVLTIFSLL